MRKLIFLVPCAVTMTLQFTINIPSPFLLSAGPVNMHSLELCTLQGASPQGLGDLRPHRVGFRPSVTVWASPLTSPTSPAFVATCKTRNSTCILGLPEGINKIAHGKPVQSSWQLGHPNYVTYNCCHCGENLLSGKGQCLHSDPWDHPETFLLWR